MDGGVEKCIMEINCNGVVQMTGFSDSNNQGPEHLEEDLHNANDCGEDPLAQEENNFHGCSYSQRNGDSEDRPQETMVDSCVPIISEVLDSMVCQATSSEEQSYNEQEISHLQQRIQAELPSEDENENGSSVNKGIRGVLYMRKTTSFPLLGKSCAAEQNVVLMLGSQLT